MSYTVAMLSIMVTRTSYIYTSFQRSGEYLLRFDRHLILLALPTASVKPVKVFFRYISKTADGYLYLLAAICALAYNSPESRYYLWCLAAGFAVERPLYFFLKNTIKRDRPFIAIPNLTAMVAPGDRFSFPSGHTSAAFMFGIVTAAVIPEAFIVLMSYALLVGISRIIMGVHYPSDIIAGSCLGIFIGSMIIKYI